MKRGDPARDLFLGFVKIHALHHAGEAPFYGQEFMDEIERHGYKLSFGVLYPLLHRMEAAGYLASEERTVDGSRRKYYSITEFGREALDKAKGHIKELTDEIG